MINIYDFLNKPNSQIDYQFNYTEQELIEDWKKLQKYHNKDFGTAAQTRPGMKLCEYFFPNFFDIKNSKGKGFTDFWNEQDLQKVLRWNRKSHSTPYLSEIRRGVIFCNGLTKNTMYRPHLSKMINEYYNSKNTIDPCCGWGGRLLGTVSAGAHYTGFEPNDSYWNTGYGKQGMQPHILKEYWLNEAIFKKYGDDPYDYYAIESNHLTRAMYKSYGIKADKKQDIMAKYK